MKTNEFLSTFDEIREYLDSAFSGDARRDGQSPELDIRSAEILSGVVFGDD